MNQTEFAERAGVVLESQSRYETGKTQPNAEYLARIAHQGIDVHFLLTGVRLTGDLLNPEAREVLTTFLALPAHLRQMATSVLRTMADEAGIIARPTLVPPSATVHEKKGLMRPDNRQ